MTGRYDRFETFQYENLWNVESNKMLQDRIEGEEGAKYSPDISLQGIYLEKAGDRLTVLLYKLKKDMPVIVSTQLPPTPDQIEFQDIVVTLNHMNYDHYSAMAHRAVTMYTRMYTIEHLKQLREGDIQ